MAKGILNCQQKNWLSSFRYPNTDTSLFFKNAKKFSERHLLRHKDTHDILSKNTSYQTKICVILFKKYT